MGGRFGKIVSIKAIMPLSRAASSPGLGAGAAADEHIRNAGAL